MRRRPGAARRRHAASPLVSPDSRLHSILQMTTILPAREAAERAAAQAQLTAATVRFLAADCASHGASC